MPGKEGPAIVDDSGETDTTHVGIQHRQAEVLQFIQSAAQVLFGDRHFIAHLIAALAFLPDQVPAVAVEPLLLGDQPGQGLAGGDDIGHDAPHQRQHLTGGGEGDGRFFLAASLWSDT